MGSDPTAALPAYVRKLRLRAGLSQEALAERAGLTIDTVGKLERGLRRRLFPHTARALADALGLDDPERAALIALASGRAEGPADPRPAATAPSSHADSPADTLPAPLTSFVGRERELTAAGLLVAQGMRLLTLTGAGGTGKTRLAVEGARTLGRHFPDGVSFVELAALSDPALLPQAVASVLGVRDAPGRSFADGIVAALRARTALLVLDNCEHLLDACAALIASVLRECPRVTVVATSREPLRVTGEQVYPVPPLALPPIDWAPADAGPAAAAALAAFGAVALFVNRARAVRPEFALTPANAEAVAQICRRLDGLPLAIELAAARVRVLPPEAIAARLDDRFRLVTGGARDAPARHQTLRALIDWSHDLLSSGEQLLLRRLAVFAGGCALDAAERAAGDGIEPEEVLDLLTALVDKSLVVAELQGEIMRYRLLESIRAYALDKLVESGEAALVRRRHRDWHLALVERAAAGPMGRRQARWMPRLTDEHDNLRAAMEWSLTDGADPAGALRLVIALSGFWVFRHLLQEGIAWYGRAVAAAGDTAPDLRARAFAELAKLTWLAQDPAAGVAAANASLALARAANDHPTTIRALRELALNELLTADASAAEAHLEEALMLARQIDDQERLPYVLVALAFIWIGRREPARARPMLFEALQCARATGGDEALDAALALLGYCALLDNLGAEAHAWCREALALAASMGHTLQIATNLFGVALAAGMMGRFEHAARLLGAWDALCEQHGIVFSPRERAMVGDGREKIRAAMGDAALAAALAEGRALPLDDVLREALEVAASPTSNGAPPVEDAGAMPA